MSIAPADRAEGEPPVAFVKIAVRLIALVPVACVVVTT
jgi:hypothetical protein